MTRYTVEGLAAVLGVPVPDPTTRVSGDGVAPEGPQTEPYDITANPGLLNALLDAERRATEGGNRSKWLAGFLKDCCTHALTYGQVNSILRAGLPNGGARLLKAKWTGWTESTRRDQYADAKGKNWESDVPLIDVGTKNGAKEEPVRDSPESDQDNSDQGKQKSEKEKKDPRHARVDRFHARIYNRDQLDDITPPTPLIDGGILDAGTIAVLCGQYGTYKSFLSLAWSCCIATGEPWEGREVITPGPVIYVATEGAAGINKRIRAWELGVNDGERVPRNRLFVLSGRVKLNDLYSDPTDPAMLTLAVQKTGAVLVVFDTMRKCMPGAKGNDDADMGAAMDAAADIIETTGASVLFDHHTGHEGTRARGSSVIEDDADASWLIELDNPKADRNPINVRTLRHRKAKDRAVIEDDMPLRLVEVPETDSCYVTLDSGLSVLDSAIKIDEIVTKLDELKIPDNWGRTKIRKRLTEEKLSYGNDVLNEAIRMRKR